MKKAIYLRLLILTFAAISVCSFISAMMYAVHTQDQIKEWLIKLTVSTAANYRHNIGITELSRSAGNTRITVIAPDGTVLADSAADATGMENHAEREEVKYAKRRGVTIAMRKSSTFGEKFMYASLKMEDNNTLRLAHRYSGVFSNLAILVPAILTAMIVTLALSLYLAGRFAKTVTTPLEKIVDALAAQDYAALREHTPSYYDIEKIMSSIQTLLQKITDSNGRLRDEREKVNYILSNMAEGFVLLDNKKNILLCNNSARDFFSCDREARLETLYHLTRDKSIMDAVRLALEKRQSSMFDLPVKEGRIVNAYISPSKITEFDFGATLFVVDVTAEKKLEQQKRDFFSNASHELKTPVTSICGFAEMLNTGMVAGEDEKAAIMARIETEAKRLSALVKDILTVSTLESGAAPVECAELNVAGIVGEAVAAVSPVKDGTPIEINMDLDDIFWCADKRHIYELCVNLIENAVKYNTPNGKVFVSLKMEGANLVLAVQDTGVGIPPEYHARVFERFFTVDCGRDKKVGGTGLGLSIVKHIANRYGGKISLQSAKNAGTKITVSLPFHPRLPGST